MSLVEATVILMVLGLITSVVTPSISDYVSDARHAKAKADCEEIGVTIARLTRDVGRCLKFDATAGCTKANRVDLLYSDGPDVTTANLDGAATPFSSADVHSPLNWDKDSERGDAMARQFITNAAAYPTPASTGAYLVPGPQFGLGWRGAYLSSPVGADGWGTRYLATTVFLAVASDATDAVSEGGRKGGWSRDAFCISAGANGLFETPFAHPNGGTPRGGDDYVYVFAGDTR